MGKSLTICSTFVTTPYTFLPCAFNFWSRKNRNSGTDRGPTFVCMYLKVEVLPWSASRGDNTMSLMTTFMTPRLSFESAISKYHLNSASPLCCVCICVCVCVCALKPSAALDWKRQNLHWADGVGGVTSRQGGGAEPELCTVPLSSLCFSAAPTSARIQQIVSAKVGSFPLTRPYYVLHTCSVYNQSRNDKTLWLLPDLGTYMHSILLGITRLYHGLPLPT